MDGGRTPERPPPASREEKKTPGLMLPNATPIAAPAQVRAADGYRALNEVLVGSDLGSN